MSVHKQKSTAKNITPDLSEEQFALQDETPEDVVEETPEGPVEKVLNRLMPGLVPSDEARVLAQTVRAYDTTRDVRIELERGVALVFTYTGLNRILHGTNFVHIATLDELADMSDQQIYDAVQQAGTKR